MTLAHDAPADERAVSSRARDAWRWVLWPFVVTRALIVSLGWLSTSVVRPGERWGSPHGVVDLFLRWDTGWFLRIAREGYGYYAPGKESPVAFFPLYPMLVGGLSRIGVPEVAAGLLVSNVAFYVAAVLSCVLWEREYGSVRIARVGVVFLLLWPASFFPSMVYSDGLFLALLAGVMIAGRAGQWCRAGVLGLFLGLTRSIGALVVVPLLLEAWGVGLPPGQRPKRAGVGWLALVPLGTLAHVLFLWHKFGDPLALVHVQLAWGRDMAGVVAAFERVRERAVLTQTFLVGAALWLGSLTLMMARGRSRPSNTAWCAIVWYTAASTGSLEAFPRLAMMALPAFGFVAALTDEHPTARQMILATLAMLLALYTTLLVNGYWVT
jgi:hypothetical protein